MGGEVKIKPLDFSVRNGKSVSYIKGFDAGDMYDRYSELESILERFTEAPLDEEEARAVLTSICGLLRCTNEEFHELLGVQYAIPVGGQKGIARFNEAVRARAKLRVAAGGAEASPAAPQEPVI